MTLRLCDEPISMELSEFIKSIRASLNRIAMDESSLLRFLIKNKLN